MWPWQTSSSSFQPAAANFPGMHSSGPHPQALPTQYVTSQPSVPMAGYSTSLGHGHTEYSHSHSGMGINYGISGMGSVPVNPNLTTQVGHSDSGPSSGGMVFHPRQQQEEVGGSVHGMHAVVPSNPMAPLVQGAPVNQHPQQQQQPQPQQQTIQSPLGGGASLGGGGVYHQTPSPIVSSPPVPSQQPYTGGHHVHSSSPFSVDFLLRQRPAAEATSSQVVPGYGMMSSSEEVDVEKSQGSISDNFGQGQSVYIIVFWPEIVVLKKGYGPGPG